jgi:hypothetical protein
MRLNHRREWISSCALLLVAILSWAAPGWSRTAHAQTVPTAPPSGTLSPNPTRAETPPSAAATASLVSPTLASTGSEGPTPSSAFGESGQESPTAQAAAETAAPPPQAATRAAPTYPATPTSLIAGAPAPQAGANGWPWNPVVTGAVLALIGILILVAADLLLGRWMDRGGRR